MATQATNIFNNNGGVWPFSDNDGRRPHAPRDFTASSPAAGTLRVRWTDQGSPSGLQEAHPVVVQDWIVYVCSAALAGSPSGADRTFAQTVLEKAHSIASMRSRGLGETMTLTIQDPSFADIYVLLAGVSVNNVLGVPSEPLLLFGGVLPLGNLDDVTLPAVNLTAVTDIYGNPFVDVNPSYVAPLDLGRFFGVEVHMVGYLGATGLFEMGNLVIYQTRPPGQFQSGHIYLPRDHAHTAVTAYFVSVDRLGDRADDPTLSPSVSIPGGIYA